MKRPKEWIKTDHFRQRELERGLSFTDVQSVVRDADREIVQSRGTNGGTCYRFEKTVGGRKLVVAAEIVGAKCYLKTAFVAG